MKTLISNREILLEINDGVRVKLELLIKEKGLPIDVVNCITGRARPNEDVLAEMTRTGVQIQAKETQQRRKEAEDARIDAERSRALADKSYMNNLNLTADAFISLRSLEINKELIEIAKTKGTVNIDFLIGSPSVIPQWGVKR
jgi:antitoxin component of RelBE/YafQ-DinJ toxin-antitoxin module